MLPRRGRFYLPPPSLPAGREGGVDTHYHEPRLRKTLFADSALRCFRRRVVDTCVDRPVHVRRPVRISLLIGHTHRRAPPHRRLRRCGGRCRTCILIHIDGLAHHGSLAPSHLMISLRIGACADAEAYVVRGAEADVVRACVRACVRATRSRGGSRGRGHGRWRGRPGKRRVRGVRRWRTDRAASDVARTCPAPSRSPSARSSSTSRTRAPTRTDGLPHPTFPEACVARGLNRSPNESERVLEAAAGSAGSPAALRKLFACLLTRNVLGNEMAERETLCHKFQRFMLRDLLARSRYDIRDLGADAPTGELRELVLRVELHRTIRSLTHGRESLAGLLGLEIPTDAECRRITRCRDAVNGAAAASSGDDDQPWSGRASRQSGGSHVDGPRSAGGDDGVARERDHRRG